MFQGLSDEMHNRTVIILGQTAVGKTKYAIEYAKEHNGEIISADSMQVYRGMDIGTAKPTKEEQQGIPHHLIDIRNPDENWTVSDFVRECLPLCGIPQQQYEYSRGGKMSNACLPARQVKCQMNGKIPIIVGGTGLYLWSLINGFSFPIVKADPIIREKLEKQPLSTLYSQLTTIDPISSQKIHPNDKKRIIRALEVYEITGNPISELQKQKEPRSLFAGSQIIGLNMPREKLYKRIEQRVDTMIEKGLVDEVKGLLEKGYTRELKSMQALGYKEVIDYLDNKYSFDDMVKLLKQKTRNFARRQMTWFRRFDNVEWIDLKST